MGVALGQPPQGRAGRPSVHALLLDALDELLIVRQSAARGGPGLMALCRMLARLVDAPAAGHASIHVYDRQARLTVWRQRGGAALEVTEPSAESSSAHDYWTTSTARRRLLECLDQRHLAELPLNPDPLRPTILVVGREWNFTDNDTELMSRAHRSLSVLERVINGLRSDPTFPPNPPAELPLPPLAAELTARENEVLTMLGEGLLARSIAQRLDVSERTVHKHLGNVYRKLGAHDRLLAVRRAEVLGLLPTAAGTRW